MARIKPLRFGVLLEYPKLQTGLASFRFLQQCRPDGLADIVRKEIEMVDPVLTRGAEAHERATSLCDPDRALAKHHVAEIGRIRVA